MNARIIDISVYDEYIVGTGGFIGAAGSHNDVILRTTFGEMWDGLTKNAQFQAADLSDPITVPLTADLLEPGSTRTYLIPVPTGAKAEAGIMRLALRGAEIDGDIVTNAVLAVYGQFTVKESNWDRMSQQEQDITPTQAEQLQSEIDALLDEIAAITGHTEDSEAWAVGERGGQPVDSDDETYNNNAKYYASAASARAEAAADSADDASESKTAASSYATAAQNAQNAAESAASAAQLSSSAAGESKNAAEAAQEAAEAAQSAAEGSAASAGLQAAAAADRADDAAMSSAAAQTAKNAAVTAQNSAEFSASASAGSAAQALAAQNAAEAAQEAAQEAQDAAEAARDLASGSVTEAAQKAAAAAGSATAAQEAQTGAETAQTAAEAAQSSAETAQAGAEAAQAAAEAATSSKADKVTGATEGHLAGLDAEGNLADSGIAPDTLATDDELASGLATKADKTSLAYTDKRLNYLYELTQGQAWDTEAGTTPAYQQPVPAGAKAAEIGSIGGKTVVEDGELVSAKVTEVESVGKNHVSSAAIQANTNNVILQVGVLEKGKTYTISSYGHGAIAFVRAGDSSSVSSKLLFPEFNYGGGQGVSLAYRTTTFVFDAETQVCHIQMYNRNSWDSTTQKEWQLEEGSTATAYTPYVGTLGTLEIPATLRTFLSDKGYGWSAGTVYNELNLEAKKYIQRVGSVDLGTLDWGPQNGIWAASISGKSVGIAGQNSNLLCALYVSQNSDYRDAVQEGKICSIRDNRQIGVRDSSYLDASAFKTAMSGVTLLYELATPIEYDISSYLTADNLLTVEAGGSLTFVQEGGTKLEVPNDTNYLIKLTEAI